MALKKVTVMIVVSESSLVREGKLVTAGKSFPIKSKSLVFLKYFCVLYPFLDNFLMYQFPETRRR